MESLESRLKALQESFESYKRESDARIRVLEDLLEIKESPNFVQVVSEKLASIPERISKELNPIKRGVNQFP